MPVLNDADDLYLGTLAVSAAYLGAVQAWTPPALPENTVAPVLGGSVSVGGTGTVTNGTWTQSPTSYRYQWQRLITGVWTDISAATANSFVYVDEGDHRVQLWAENGVGESTDPAISNVVTVTLSSGLATFANPNAYAALSSGDMVMSYTGAGGNVANVISSAAILEPTYFELHAHHSGAGYVGAQLYAESSNTLIDYGVLGQWYDRYGVYFGVNDRYSTALYAFYGKPTEEISTTVTASDFGDPPLDIGLHFAVSGRNVWIRSTVDLTWFGGGNPALGTTPSLVVGGTEPIRFGAASNNASNHATILTPDQFTGTPPAGFRLGVAA